MRPLAMSLATALLVAACGGTAAPSPSPSPSPTPKPTVVAKVATDATLGKILVDQAGKTVYQWFKDIDENSQCYDACAAIWPPFLVEVKTVAEGRKAAGHVQHHAALLLRSRHRGQADVGSRKHRFRSALGRRARALRWRA